MRYVSTDPARVYRWAQVNINVNRFRDDTAFILDRHTQQYSALQQEATGKAIDCGSMGR